MTRDSGGKKLEPPKTPGRRQRSKEAILAEKVQKAEKKKLQAEKAQQEAERAKKRMLASKGKKPEKELEVSMREGSPDTELDYEEDLNENEKEQILPPMISPVNSTTATVPPTTVATSSTGGQVPSTSNGSGIVLQPVQPSPPAFFTSEQTTIMRDLELDLRRVAQAWEKQNEIWEKQLELRNKEYELAQATERRLEVRNRASVEGDSGRRDRDHDRRSGGFGNIDRRGGVRGRDGRW